MVCTVPAPSFSHLDVGASQIDIVPPLILQPSVLLGLGMDELLVVRGVDISWDDGHRGGEGTGVTTAVEGMRSGVKQWGIGRYNTCIVLYRSCKCGTMYMSGLF